MIDGKTATRRPCGITPEYEAQLRTYSMITPGATGVCRLDTVTKTKAVQLVQQSCEIGPEERRCAEALYPMAQEAMRDGIYTPRSGSPLCSRRYCVYGRECDERGDACGIDPKWVRRSVL
jgi:hypothetical protein